MNIPHIKQIPQKCVVLFNIVFGSINYIKEYLSNFVYYKIWLR